MKGTCITRDTQKAHEKKNIQLASHGAAARSDEREHLKGSNFSSCRGARETIKKDGHTAQRVSTSQYKYRCSRSPRKAGRINPKDIGEMRLKKDGSVKVIRE